MFETGFDFVIALAVSIMVFALAIVTVVGAIWVAVLAYTSILEMLNGEDNGY